MMRWVASVCVLLVACGPVLLVGDDEPEALTTPPADRLDSGVAGGGGASGAAAGPAEPTVADEAAPHAVISVRPADCGKCFELLATGMGGVAPYRFEWEDGSQSPARRVCPEQTLEVSVIVQDANSARGPAYVTRLEIQPDASCPEPPGPPARLCVMNASFEGMAAYNMGVPESFDAPPWNACAAPSVSNTPDIANEDIAQTPVPPPTDGDTFLGLAVGEQASQTLCETMRGGTELSMELDLSRVDVSSGTVPIGGTVFLEIWGGVAADCTQRQLLWASEPLAIGWNRYCVKLQPAEFMDQITLRANSDNMGLAPSYVLADNLVPVDDCP